VGGNPMRVTSIYSLIAYMEREFGVHYAWGGTGALVKGMVDLINGQGGQVRCNAPVEKLIIENGTAQGVVLENGERIAADVVVSNADSSWTYNNLLADHKPKRWTKRKLKKTHLSMSLFVWYFGTDKKFDDVDHHTILMGPRYQGLLKDMIHFMCWHLCRIWPVALIGRRWRNRIVQSCKNVWKIRSCLNSEIMLSHRVS
jgi:phytoene desaturase